MWIHSGTTLPIAAQPHAGGSVWITSVTNQEAIPHKERRTFLSQLHSTSIHGQGWCWVVQVSIRSSVGAAISSSWSPGEAARHSLQALRGFRWGEHVVLQTTLVLETPSEEMRGVRGAFYLASLKLVTFNIINPNWQLANFAILILTRSLTRSVTCLDGQKLMYS